MYVFFCWADWAWTKEKWLNTFCEMLWTYRSQSILRLIPLTILAFIKPDHTVLTPVNILLSPLSVRDWVWFVCMGCCGSTTKPSASITTCIYYIFHQTWLHYINCSAHVFRPLPMGAMFEPHVESYWPTTIISRVLL